MSLRKGLGIFLFLALGVSALVVAGSIDQSAVDAVLHMKKINILYILCLVFLSWSCDATRFCFTAKAMGYSIPFVRGLVLTWLHYFGCALTPMQVGGGPFQVYVLYKSGIPVGSGIAITLVRTLFSTFLLSLAAPMAFFLIPQLAEGGFVVKGIFFYVGTLSVIMWGLFLTSIIKIDFIKRFVGYFFLRLRCIRCFKKLNVKKVYSITCAELNSYSENVKRMLGPGLPFFLGAFALSVFQLVTLFSVLPLLMKAVGLFVDYVHAVFAQAMFMFILYFIPTPGASGVAEGGGAAIFSMLMPANMTGIMAVLWRLFTEYLSIFMGCIVAIKMIGWGTAERIIGGAQDDVIAEEQNKAENEAVKNEQ